MEWVLFFAHLQGITLAELAQNADLPLATVERCFKAEGDVELDLLILLVRGLGLEVRELFELVYPGPSYPSAALAKVHQILKQTPPDRLPEGINLPEGVLPTREDVEKMLDQFQKDILKSREGRPDEENGEA